jgi:hypothetical protein
MTRSKWYRRRGRWMDVAGRGARGITPADLITPVHLVGRAVPVTPADPVGRAELPELVGRAHPVARVDLPELVDPVGRVELPEPAARADLADQAELGRPAEADPAEADSAAVALAEADSAGVASAAVAVAVASAEVAEAAAEEVAEAAAADSSLSRPSLRRRRGARVIEGLLCRPDGNWATSRALCGHSGHCLASGVACS